MKYLYLLLDIGSLSIPLIFSIAHKTDPFKNLKKFTISTALIATLFLIWDAVFTHLGIWGFSEQYTIGFKLAKMPIEEWMFFFTIPYASLFIHFVIEKYRKREYLKLHHSKIISYILITVCTLLLILNTDKSYTFLSYLSCLIVLIIGLVKYPQLLSRFYVSFLVILIPFVIVNGILTGSFILDEVVWYNNEENLGVRFYTIPVEDFGYAFSMLFSNLMVFTALKNR